MFGTVREPLEAIGSLIMNAFKITRVWGQPLSGQLPKAAKQEDLE